MDSTTDSMLYYGTLDRHRSSQYTTLCAIQTTASDLGLVHFSSRAEMSLYLSNMTNVKDIIDSLAHDFRENHKSEDQFKASLRNKWIPATNAFMSKWSKYLVPIDIRIAIADVRRNIDLSPVVWPPLLCLSRNNDGTYSFV